MNTVPTIPSAYSYLSTDTSSTGFWNISTPSTNLYITSSVTGVDQTEGYGEDNGIEYVKRKSSRQAKKQRGSTIDANHPKHRIKNLLKPVVLFKFVKENFKLVERRELSSRLERISQLLESTAITNQIALREKIQDKLGKLIREQEMISCRFDKFFEKEILQAFVDSVREKVIKITPVRNYVRLIPKEIRKLMEIAKEKKLFDDFVVVHCDPENKAVEKTKEEKKDPILFGIIRESPRYYFVGDWQDELCDLTMDTILQHLGLEESDVTLPDEVETALLEIL